MDFDAGRRISPAEPRNWLHVAHAPALRDPCILKLLQRNDVRRRPLTLFPKALVLIARATFVARRVRLRTGMLPVALQDETVAERGLRPWTPMA